jgi:hypothetical protein
VHTRTGVRARASPKERTRVGGISVGQSRVKVRTQRALHDNARGCLRSFKLAERGLVHIGAKISDAKLGKDSINPYFGKSCIGS